MYCFFFKQKTAYEMRISDWSSDVFSSDLTGAVDIGEQPATVRRKTRAGPFLGTEIAAQATLAVKDHVVAGKLEQLALWRQSMQLLDHTLTGRILTHHQAAARAEHNIVGIVDHCANGRDWKSAVKDKRG